MKWKQMELYIVNCTLIYTDGMWLIVLYMYLHLCRYIIIMIEIVFSMG